jgi:hypothetical protein
LVLRVGPTFAHPSLSDSTDDEDEEAGAVFGVAIADALKVNHTITTIKYGAPSLDITPTRFVVPRAASCYRVGNSIPIIPIFITPLPPLFPA